MVSPDAKSPLERLGAAVGQDFSNLLKARELTASRLEVRQQQIAELEHDGDAAVVLMGSWGRAEVTSGSDDDFMVVVDGPVRSDVKPSIVEVEGVLDRAPGDQGIFGEPVFCSDLVENIGLDRDDNTNLTRRMLFLLESVSLTSDAVYRDAHGKVLARYLDESVKSFRPPRFLLNDTIRYWRTMCVDFVGKEAQGSPKWGLRNAKLRLSRKVLFTGGLLPILDCSRFGSKDIPGVLERRFQMPPSDRIAEAFLEHDAADADGRALGAYDEFIGLLNKRGVRAELEGVTRSSAADSVVFNEVRRLGEDLEHGLLALLFETGTLPQVVRDYGIF